MCVCGGGGLFPNGLAPLHITCHTSPHTSPHPSQPVPTTYEGTGRAGGLGCIGGTGRSFGASGPSEGAGGAARRRNLPGTTKCGKHVSEPCSYITRLLTPLLPSPFSAGQAEGIRAAGQCRSGSGRGCLRPGGRRRRGRRRTCRRRAAVSPPPHSPLPGPGLLGTGPAGVGAVQCGGSTVWGQYSVGGDFLGIIPHPTARPWIRAATATA